MSSHCDDILSEIYQPSQKYGTNMDNWKAYTYRVFFKLSVKRLLAVASGKTEEYL